MNKRAKQKAKENTIQRNRHRTGRNGTRGFSGFPGRIPKAIQGELFADKDDIGREKTKEEVKEGK